jgi:hypothetical protein
MKPHSAGTRVRKGLRFYPPDVVAPRRDLANGQKRLYERGVRWAGQNGIFWNGFEKMAEELGKSVRQVRDDMAALEAKGLISHVRRRRNSNVHSFLWQQRSLVDLIREHQFGRIENMPVRKGQPILDRDLKIVRAMRLGGKSVRENAASTDEFELKRSVGSLFDELTRHGDGTVTRLEFRHGLPFLIEIVAAIDE